ncbi:hypothetical protein, partial [Komagataeibacter diospyri]|uniref:hypothetical protein n=1 Tax=Komagataeibacter diospyri TaxID=1932662 RepID=UPI001D05029F
RQYEAIHMVFETHHGPLENSIPNSPQKAVENVAFKKGDTQNFYLSKCSSRLSCTMTSPLAMMQDIG